MGERVSLVVAAAIAMPVRGLFIVDRLRLFQDTVFHVVRRGRLATNLIVEKVGERRCLQS